MQTLFVPLIKFFIIHGIVLSAVVMSMSFGVGSRARICSQSCVNGCGRTCGILCALLIVMSLDVSKSAQQVCQATRTVDAPTAEADNAASANLELATMHMSGESLLVIIVVGVIAGWLAGQIVQGTGFGLIGDFVIGVIGAFIGSWLLPQLGVRIGVGMVAAIANATIGAILLLILLRAIRGSGRFGGRGWWAR